MMRKLIAGLYLLLGVAAAWLAMLRCDGPSHTRLESAAFGYVLGQAVFLTVYLSCKIMKR
jgi:hypothetical protein